MLTNGLTYRVYKTNEPVAMDQKLLFEVDFAEIAAGSAADAAKSLQLLSRQSLIEGALDLWGERVFTDTRVRKALSGLAARPPKRFLATIEEAMGSPAVPPERLRESLARIFDSQLGAAGDPAPASPQPPKPPTSAPTAAGKKEFSIKHHLDGKPAAIVDMFEQLDEYGRSLGADVSRRVRQNYIAYFRGKRSFFTVELQRQRTLVYLTLEPAAARPWNEDAMRGVTNIGHFGMGHTEYSIRGADSLPGARDLIRLAYEKSS